MLGRLRKRLPGVQLPPEPREDEGGVEEPAEPVVADAEYTSTDRGFTLVDRHGRRFTNGPLGQGIVPPAGWGGAPREPWNDRY